MNECMCNGVHPVIDSGYVLLESNKNPSFRENVGAQLARAFHLFCSSESTYLLM